MVEGSIKINNELMMILKPTIVWSINIFPPVFCLILLSRAILRLVHVVSYSWSDIRS